MVCDMLQYFLKRLVLIIPIVIAITFIVFFILSLSSDPTYAIIGYGATPESVAELREELGFNDPLLVRYADWFFKVFRGDFGTSYFTNIRIVDELQSRLPVTLKLSVLSIILVTVLSIPLGIISAVKQYSVPDTVLQFFAFVLAAVPPFWLGMLLTLLFSISLRWLPSIGADGPLNYIMPTITLVASIMAQQIRTTRSSMLEVIGQDYIRTAKAKGQTPSIIIRKHALRNALIPIITVIGVNFGMIIAGAVIVETVFAMPGFGTYLIEGVKKGDVPVVMGCIIFAAVSICLINLLVDMGYAFIDPRVKREYVEKSKLLKLRGTVGKGGQ